MATFNFLFMMFAPTICLFVGYVKGRIDEARERDARG
jgi:hypothetical protein